MIEALEKAKVLVEALPYIQRFRDKFVVVKLGGSAMDSEEGAREVLRSIVLLEQVGMRLILVHGGGKFITEEMERRGKKTTFVSGQRVTDEETLEIVKDVLINDVNLRLVRLIEELKGSAIGIYPGVNGCLFGEKSIALGADGSHIDLGFVGRVTRVDERRLSRLTSGGIIAVVAPLAEGEGGVVYNVNADLCASGLAGELRAEKLVLLTNVPGILQRKDDPCSLISTASTREIEKLRAQGILNGGMVPKVEACLDALRKGVKKTHIIDGSNPYSILLEIFTDQGIGTEIVP